MPLMYAALASQKNHMAVYLMGLYCKPGSEVAFRKAWRGGRKLDMGKSCIRFKQLEDLDPHMIAKAIAATSVENFITVQARKPRK